ncbi:MAG: YraN family protein [Candidatus Cloacimonetes bacterium]|nr:YraN family protein [Candidatus Cloacimonadota bacterium]
MVNNHKNELFITGEFIASRYLENKGYAIRERNYRTPYGEIDIIACYEGTLVFTEVKTRSNKAVINTLSNISRAKKIRLTRSAIHYMIQLPPDVTFCTRFDVILLFHYSKDDTYQLHHFEDAFEPIIEDSV